MGLVCYEPGMNTGHNLGRSMGMDRAGLARPGLLYRQAIIILVINLNKMNLSDTMLYQYKYRSKNAASYSEAMAVKTGVAGR